MSQTNEFHQNCDVCQENKGVKVICGKTLCCICVSNLLWEDETVEMYDSDNGIETKGNGICTQCRQIKPVMLLDSGHVVCNEEECLGHVIGCCGCGGRILSEFDTWRNDETD